MRTKKSIRNIATALVGQFLGLLITFFARMVFIRVLGAEYLGVNGLFTSVISMLSLAEMGLGTAIIYSLYRPLALGEEQKIKALMRFYRSAYHRIGLVVLVLGLSILPFMDFIIKGNPIIPNLNLIYCLFLADSVSSYYFTYKRSLIVADQKSHIVTTYHAVFFTVSNVVQLVALVLTRNFILFLVVRFLFNLLENLMLARKAEALYPFLKTRTLSELEPEEKKGIYRNVKALFFHRLGLVVLEGTDHILIAAFAGIVQVGLYSNYYLVITALNSIIGQVFSAVTASVGNLNALESHAKQYLVFKAIFLANFWFYGFSSICLYVLVNPFITLWLGKEYVMNEWIVTLIIIIFFVTGMRKATLMFRDSLGLFWNERYKPLFESVINLVASISLVVHFGIIGVLLGTLISTMTTCFWVEPYVLYAQGFKTRLREYFYRYGLYVVVTLGAGWVTWYVVSLVDGLLVSLGTDSAIISFVGKLVICLIIPNVIFWFTFSYTKEFRYLRNIVRQVSERA